MQEASTSTKSVPIEKESQANRELASLRVDDIPIIYSMLVLLDIDNAIDQAVRQHGNWLGLSPGKLTCLWLCYILSECDHRLSVVEDWAEQRIALLQALLDDKSVSSKDFSDDKLGLLLDYLSQDSNWLSIERAVNQTGIGLYRLTEPGSSPTFRLDSAPMQSHGTVEEGGLLQYGYSKHHNGNLGQFKIQLCSLDNELNNFAYPISHITVSGEQADDGLYLPVIAKVKSQLNQQPGYEQGNLFVGDGKMGSISNRATIAHQKDYYLMPLSKVQLSDAARLSYITSVDASIYQEVFKTAEAGTSSSSKVIAKGFEQTVKRTYDLEAAQGVVSWEERLVFVRSDYYANQQTTQLDKSLAKTTECLVNLTTPKQGKKVLKSYQEVQQAVDKILKNNNLKDLLNVNIEQSEQVKIIRAYGNKPQRKQVHYTFNIRVERQEEQIEKRKKLMGWQVYASNAPDHLLPFEKCVWKYRYQSNIERQFDNIRNKVVKLLPVYLNTDTRIIGLVNLLMLALKACCLVEYKVAKALKENEEELGGIYEGNPKRTTAKPSAKRLFKAFNGISMALVFKDKQLDFVLMTKLEPVQKKILHFLGLEADLFEDLKRKIQMSFSINVLTET